MKKILYDYKEDIKKLPLKNKYTRDELLIDKFLLDKENNIEIYYAPHNEYLNPKAKVLMILYVINNHLHQIIDYNFVN